MAKDMIITLDDDTSYALLDETTLQDKKYFFAVKLDDKNNPTTSYEVFQEDYEDGEYYINTLDESDYKQALLIDFTNNYMEKVGELIINKGEEN